MPVTISDRQQLVRNCFAYGSDLGVMLVSNGEEKPYTLFADGTIIDAGLPTPAIPTVADNGAGNLPNGEFCVYAVLYVIEGTYPLIAARMMGQPSPYSATYEVTGAGDRQTRITFAGTSNAAVNKVRIYRTDFYSDATNAELAADAGSLYYLGEVTNAVGTLTYDDNTASNIGNDAIELDNFPSPQFRFCAYDGEYFWGFGNHPLRFEGSWTSPGVVTVLDDTLFYTDGRNDQYVTFEGVTTGGIDGKGTFLFKYVSNGSFQTVDEDGANLAIGSADSGSVVVCGETANLYRSKYKNPYAWGYMKAYADEYIPEIWAIRVSGGLGTAIAIFPDSRLIKLDMEYPAECITYNLQTAATDVFEGTKAWLSRHYSVTSHFSQFPAVSNGREVLWGMDFKNLCIVESDGVSQIPVSSPVSSIIRELAATRPIQLISHGVYDPFTEINAMWVGTGSNDDFKIDLCIYQHSPSGYWGVIDDYDVICSALIEDSETTRKRVLVGTEGGFVGYAFDESTFGNFLPTSGAYQGTITAIGNLGEYIDLSISTLHSSNKSNYVVIVDTDGLSSQTRRIAVNTGSRIQFDTPLDTPLPAVGSAFYVGMIPVSVLKYFDKGVPNMDKGLREVWMTLENASAPQIRYYPEHSDTPTAALTLKHDASLDAWFLKNGFPTTRQKTFGIELFDHSYQQLKFYNITVAY